MATPPARRAPAVVLSVGGSVFLHGEDDESYVKGLGELLRAFGREAPLAVTVGGGRTAREYIALGRRVGLTEFELDELGIDVTRLHARLLAALVGAPTVATPPTSVAEATRELHRVSPVILGGTEPGHTTDAVAALLAVRLRARLVVNATSVDGVYDKDPQQHSDSRRYDRLSWPEFGRLVQANPASGAGERFVFDRLGAELLERAQIPLRVVDGRDLSNLKAALEGRKFRGTRIES